MTRLPFAAALLLLLLLAACDRDPRQDDLDTSRERWEAIRDGLGGSYAYSVPTSSWVGSGTLTRLRVENNRVVERSYTAHDADNQVTESWTEVGSKLGTHDRGAPIRGVDDLYDVCADEVLTVDTDENDITLTFDGNGILHTCTYFPRNCADDCAVGVTLQIEAVRR